MKICLITNLYHPHIIGGAEIYAGRISEGLSEKEQVIVITSRPFEGIKSLFARVDICGKTKIFSFYPLNFYHVFSAKRKPAFLKALWHILDIWNLHSYLVFRSILKKEKPDIIHTHNLNGFSLSICRAIKKSSAGWVHTAHDFSLLCPLANLRCGREKTFLCSSNPISVCGIYRSLKKIFFDNRQDLVIFPSVSCRSVFQGKGFFLKQENRVMPYCVSIPEVSHTDHGLDFEVLYAGQLVEHKGVGLLLEVFKKAAAKDWRLHIAGDGQYRSSLEMSAGQDKRIVFHGKLSGQALWELYCRADVTVVPSLWPEVLGIVILESLACSTPVIASDIGGIPEVVKDKYNGLLVNPGDPRALKDALELMASDRQLTKEMRTNALRSSGKFRVKEHISKLEGIYESVLDRPRGSE